MNLFVQKARGVFAGWSGNGPWRSKSVLAALAAVVAGTGFWLSDIEKSPPPNEAGNAAVTNAPGITLTNSTVAPAQTHWHWSKPFPLYVKVGASYVAGFCIGWFFRKLLRLIVIIVALAVALIALGRFVGCDTTHTTEHVKRSGAWAQHEATAARDYLLHLLPSAAGGGAGVFLGFRRRGKTAASGPAADGG